jgi:hypothetical protein
MTTSENSSPLSQVNPKSLNELFNTAPDDLTDAEVGAIVAKLQEDRRLFLATPPKAKSKKVAADLNMTIDDLGF